MKRIVVLCIVCLFYLQTIHPLALDLTAEAALLINADTGATLYEKKADKKIYPASLTKIITALYSLEKSRENLHEMTRVSKEALKYLHSSQKKKNNYQDPAHWLEDNVVLLWIHAGLKISLKDLLYGMMLRSANDAANALAEAQSGSIPEFMEEINAYLQKIGCVSTQFLNPHGIHHPDHYTTARDLAFMTRVALANPEFVELISTLSYSPSVKFGPTQKWLQVNRLLKKGKYYYPQAIGGKTGFHSSSGYSLVAAAECEERRLIGVVIGTRDAEQRYKEMIQLFDAAFAEKKVQRVCFTQAQLFTRKVEGDRTLKARLKGDISLAYYPSEEPQDIKAYTVFKELELPIEVGQQVGEIHLFSGEKLLQASPLFACEKIEDTFLLRMKRRLRKWLQ